MSNLLMWRGGGVMTHSAAIHQGAIDMFSLSRSPHIVHLYICHWFRSSKAESKCLDFPALVWVLMAAQTHGQQGPSSWLSADFTGLHCFNYPQFIAIGTWRFSSCALQKKKQKTKRLMYVEEQAIVLACLSVPCTTMTRLTAVLHLTEPSVWLCTVLIKDLSN